jgi:hypothetical protein
MKNSALYERWEKIHEKLGTNAKSAVVYQGFFDCKFGQTYIGVDDVGNESIMIFLDKVAADMFEQPNVSGLFFEIVEEPILSSDDKFLKIGVAPGHSGINEAFEAFTVTLVGRLSLIDSTVEAVEEIYEVCKDYADFFGKGCKTALSFIEEEGLYGELTILRKCLEKIGDKAINCWMGPDKSRHDFVFQDNKSIEVKSSLKQNRKIISISNDMQLTNTGNADLFLTFMILELNPSGQTIGDLINEIYGKLASQKSKDDFDQKLLESKVVRGQIATKRRFIVIETHNYRVNEAFPRLTLDDVHAKSNRIYDLKYKVDLDGLDELVGDIYEYLGA